MNNKGRTQTLSESLAALFQIPPKNIKVGGTLVHKYGAIVHIVHMVSKSELDIMEEEMNEDGSGIDVNARLYTKELCLSMESELDELFRDHFELSDEFCVEYNVFGGVKRRTMMKEINDNNGTDAIDAMIHRKLLRRFASHARMSMKPNYNSNGVNIKFEEMLMQKIHS